MKLLNVDVATATNTHQGLPVRREYLQHLLVLCEGCPIQSAALFVGQSNCIKRTVPAAINSNSNETPPAAAPRWHSSLDDDDDAIYSNSLPSIQPLNKKRRTAVIEDHEEDMQCTPDADAGLDDDEENVCVVVVDFVRNQLKPLQHPPKAIGHNNAVLGIPAIDPLAMEPIALKKVSFQKKNKLYSSASHAVFAQRIGNMNPDPEFVTRKPTRCFPKRTVLPSANLDSTLPKEELEAKQREIINELHDLKKRTLAQNVKRATI